MRQLITLIVMLVCGAQVSSAQKRNIIKLGGVSLDISPENVLEASDEELFGTVNLGYSFGYERLIGSHVSFGLSFTKLIPLSSGENNTPPKSTPGYEFIGGTYTRGGFTLGYESRYYFGSFDEDGVNSPYLGFTYRFGSYTESMDGVSYTSYYWGGPKPPPPPSSYPDQTFSVNTFGVRFGYAGANAVLSDFFAGINVNAIGQTNKEWISGKPMSAVSFQIGWNFGIPFH